MKKILYIDMDNVIVGFKSGIVRLSQEVPGAIRSEKASRIEPKPKGLSVGGSCNALRVSFILRDASSL